MALENMDLKTKKKLISCGRGANREERKREKKRKRKKKKRRRGREDQEVWNYDLYHGFYEIMYDFPCLYD